MALDQRLCRCGPTPLFLNLWPYTVVSEPTALGLWLWSCGHTRYPHQIHYTGHVRHTRSFAAECFPHSLCLLISIHTLHSLCSFTALCLQMSLCSLHCLRSICGICYLLTSWSHCGPSWVLLGSSWDPLGPSWEPLGGFLEASWRPFGRLLEASGALLDVPESSRKDSKALEKTF